MRIREIITEEINSAITEPSFRDERKIGEFIFKAQSFQPVNFDKPSRKKNQNTQQWFEVVCKDGDKTIGHAIFKVMETGASAHLESHDTEVDPMYRKQGIATAMYDYAKALGNDILPSPAQLPGGKAMWAAWQKSGKASQFMPAGINTSDNY